ncbi:16S rRNA (adenine(1518)-N(6)/adenine(1519)-N(6))-dimethyltransferase RsmA [Terriglobus aquaticus]|uniref:Ribosomal RNA small subunit methyltransferase A n=1 Tax=Terriglobus aquaticus TaxID=940139 RepID=A0ABW9KL88_9BACT|nr:16S rRNA (adenine(1518)-N(6)/adenine(1519)-N(6))-dimethyltransferase RsmA [Terriglobus aquaticus]
MKHKPKLGQNFLVDADAARRIAEALGDITTETVLEIGPGHGAITGLLAERAGHLICVELDRALAAELRFRFRNATNVQILEADILTVDLSALRPENGKLRVIGNLPYYITSDILLHLCRHASAIDTAVVMMQREVADRVAASPGSRDYGVLSVSVQRHADVSSMLTLPPSAFSPPPDVFSTVLHLRMRDRSSELGVLNDAAFTRLLRAAFAQKRKTLGNNLRSAGYSPDRIRAACEAAGVTSDLRAEALSVSQFAALYHALGASPSATSSE